MNLADRKVKPNQPQLSDLYDALVSLMEQAPEHGTLTLVIHMRDGVPHRFETSRQESVFFKQGGQKWENQMAQ